MSRYAQQSAGRLANRAVSACQVRVESRGVVYDLATAQRVVRTWKTAIA